MIVTPPHTHTQNVTRYRHPSRCWPRSPMLNLRDQKRYSTASRKASSLARQYKFPLILSATLPPSQGSFDPKAWREFYLDVWHLFSNDIHRSWRQPPSSPDETMSVHWWILIPSWPQKPRVPSKFYLKQAPIKHQSHYTATILQHVADTHPGADHACRCLTCEIKRHSILAGTQIYRATIIIHAEVWKKICAWFF
jgi:hypothetical protein